MSTRRIKNSWWVDFRADHIRHRIRSPENSQAGAKAYEAVLRRRLAAGEPLKPVPPQPTAPTFAEFSAEWFETHVRTNCKPSSQRSRAHVLRNHLVPFFGTSRLTDITTGRVEQYKARKVHEGLSPKTINEHLGILGKCLRDARDWDKPAADPKLKPLRLQKPAFDCLKEEEAERLLAAMTSTRWKAMATLALHTGLRRGELFGLRWEDVDLEDANLVVRQSIVEGIVGPPKNYRERSIPLDQAALVALASMPRTHDLVFHRGNGRPLTCSTAQGALHRACLRASLRPIGWHAFRHTFASWLATAGVPVPSIQALLGHSTITMTMRYTHIASSALRAAVSVLDPRRPILSPESWATAGHRAPICPLPTLAAGIA
jgi:integrase